MYLIVDVFIKRALSPRECYCVASFDKICLQRVIGHLDLVDCFLNDAHFLEPVFSGWRLCLSRVRIPLTPRSDGQVANIYLAKNCLCCAFVEPVFPLFGRLCAGTGAVAASGVLALSSGTEQLMMLPPVELGWYCDDSGVG